MCNSVTRYSCLVSISKPCDKIAFVPILSLLKYTLYVLCWDFFYFLSAETIWAPSSEFVSSSIPSWQILTAHAQTFRGARGDLAFCLKIPLDSLLVWASSGGSGETARMRRLAWTFAARIGDKYQIGLTRSIWCHIVPNTRYFDFYNLHTLFWII